MAESQPPAATSIELKSALREARATEAAHRDAARLVRDGDSLRLNVLAEEVKQLFATSREAEQVFDVSLAAGEEPKLWIDGITSVVMAGDHRNYVLREDQPGGLAVLLETPDRSEILKFLRTLLAHRLVMRARQEAGQADLAGTSQGYSMAALLLAWATGLACGALGFLTVAILLKFL